MTTYTASGVRDLSRKMAVALVEMDARPPKDEHVMAALDAYADLLEAREKAVPVAWQKVDDPLNVTADPLWAQLSPMGWTSLYTHPPTASVTDAMKRAFEHLASIGYPKNARGNYDKDGEWTFSDAVPRDVDEREVSAAFHALEAYLTPKEPQP